MTYYTNTHGLYYNAQFDLDKVKEEIIRIGNLQNDLKGYLAQIDQTYKNVQQQHDAILSLNNRLPNNVKITNEVEESKLEIKDVTNYKTITTPFNEEIPFNLKGRVEQLEKIPNDISNINNSFLLKYGAYDNVNNQITFKKNSSSNDMKTKITIPFGTNLANDGNGVKFLENRVLDCINIDKGLNLNIDKDKNLVIHDYGITALDEVSSNRKITIPFNTDFEQIKKNIDFLNENTKVLTSDDTIMPMIC
jgi:hypothetical protein